MYKIIEHMFDEEIAHGTPFRRAYEEGLIDAQNTFQIALRGTGYGPDDFDTARNWGFTVVQAEELWYKSAAPLMEKIRQQIGDEKKPRETVEKTVEMTVEKTVEKTVETPVDVMAQPLAAN